MRKSIWIEVVEWCVFGLIVLFMIGVLTMREQITASASSDSPVPRVSLDE